MISLESKELGAILDLTTLKQEYLKTRRELDCSRNKTRKQDLRKRLDNLAMELEWAFCDCGEYEKGLARYSFLSWETHGEGKCNGMVRA